MSEFINAYEMGRVHGDIEGRLALSLQIIEHPEISIEVKRLVAWLSNRTNPLPNPTMRDFKVQNHLGGANDL